MRLFRMRRALAVLAVCAAGSAAATVYPLPPPDVDVIGEVRRVPVVAGETLLDIGRRHGVGYDELLLANPELDPWAPAADATVLLPTRYVLPSGPREGIVVNIPEMRLYFYPPAKPGEAPVVETYPISVGRMDWRTPVGLTRVTAKQKDPPWYPPASVRAEARADGREMPKVVPAGPDNPLGRHAIRLALPSYLIHGTNNPWGVGMRVTHGCVRMYPEDIEAVFDRVPVGTAVRIVNQPYKVGWHAGRMYLEVHPVLEEERANQQNPLVAAANAVSQRLTSNGPKMDYARLKQVVAVGSGVPAAVSRGQFADQGELLSGDYPR